MIVGKVEGNCIKVIDEYPGVPQKNELIAKIIFSEDIKDKVLNIITVTQGSIED